MLIDLTTTITEKQQVELEVPAFFVENTETNPTHAMVCANGNLVKLYSHGSIGVTKKGGIFSESDIGEIVSKYIPSTESAFFDAYAKAYNAILDSVAPMPVAQ